MASIEAVSEAVSTERLADLDPEALADLEGLVADSHWNQTADDWALFHQAGTIHVVRKQGRIIASGAVLPMGAPGRGETGVSWISMILVTPDERARGLGRAVFARCLRDVQESGRIPMLDATPAGEALYRQFGFEPLWRLTRWRREPRAATAAALGTSAPQLETLVALDRQVLGFERPHLLAHFLARAGTRCLRQADALALVREGRNAHQIGPVLAAQEAAAASALTRAAASLPGPLSIDVPDERPRMRAALLAAGFQPQRGFARMARIAPGQVLPAGQTALLHAIAGPEFA
jgi:GNAT superfamily N-acetyltransferase